MITHVPLLLHVCCAPCMTVVHKALSLEGFRVTAFFYNPNIHPFQERQRRLETLTAYSDSEGIPLETVETYPLEENIRMLLEAENRCYACFEDRLSATADKADEMGMPAFSTTLSVSPYQNQEQIIRAGEKAAFKAGVEFIYRDFRDLYNDSVRISRENGMYRQPYCGCVFSERDRYLKIKSPGMI